MKKIFGNYFTINRNNWSTTVKSSVKIGFIFGLIAGIIIYVNFSNLELGVILMSTSKQINLSPLIFSFLYKLSIALIGFNLTIDLYFSKSISYYDLILLLVLLYYSKENRHQPIKQK